MREKKGNVSKGSKGKSSSGDRKFSKKDSGKPKRSYVKKDHSASPSENKKPARSFKKEEFPENRDFKEKSERSTYKGNKSEAGKGPKRGAPSSTGSKRPARTVNKRFSERVDNAEKTDFKKSRPSDTDDYKSKDSGEHKKKYAGKESRSFASDTKRTFRNPKGRYPENAENTEKSERNTYKGSKSDSGDRKEKSSYRTSRSKSTYKPDFKKKGSDDGTTRLNRYIANAGICSRREADRLIESGAVSINGKIVTELGTKVSASDVVNYGGQTLRKEKPVYILLNKPKDYITTLDDPQGRKTVMTLIADACRERVYPVGRLDRATTGLLLFTNDGDMAKKLVHPRFGVKKIYHVELDKAITKVDMDKIAAGLELEDGIAKVDAIALEGNGADKKSLGIEIHSGKNRIVRRIFESLGYDVRKLDRVYFAGLTKKDIPRGRWRFLTQMEVNMLMMLK